jgi:hypothetical protein
MSSYPTIAPAADDRALRLVRLAAQAGTVLVFAAGMAVVVRSACLDPGPPVALPEPGTPRAGYCDTVRAGTLWLLLVGVPVVLAAVACSVPPIRRRPVLGWVVVGVIGTALWANAAYIGTLDFAYTV